MVQAQPFVIHRTAAGLIPGEFIRGQRRSKWIWNSILSEFLRFSPNIRHSTVAPLTYAVTQTRKNIITSSWLHLSGRMAGDSEIPSNCQAFVFNTRVSQKVSLPYSCKTIIASCVLCRT